MKPQMVPDRLSRQLAKIAERTNRGVDELVQEAIEDWLRQQPRTNGRSAEQQKPALAPTVESSLGAQLRRIREDYIASGGVLLSADEVAREVAERRGERSQD